MVCSGTLPKDSLGRSIDRPPVERSLVIHA